MRLTQLKYLVELSKHRTISKTAQVLYISQPSLSTAIKELEEELGFDILERSNKGVAFTKRGALVLKYSQDIMHSVNSIERMGKQLERSRKGYLSIGSVSYIFSTVVMDAFLELKNRYPDMVATVREENSYDMVEMLANKEIDLGIVMISNIEELNFQQVFDKYNLQFYKLFDDQMYFIVGRQHPLYGRQSATMQEMLQYPFLTRRKILNQYNKNMLLRYNDNLEFIQIDDGESLKKYLANSQAVCVMPRCAFWKSSYRLGDALHAIQIEEFVWRTKIGWIFPKDEHYSIEEEEFVELLEEKIFEYEL